MATIYIISLPQAADFECLMDAQIMSLYLVSDPATSLQELRWSFDDWRGAFVFPSREIALETADQIHRLTRSDVAVVALDDVDYDRDHVVRAFFG
jgi:hypothetical protein